MGGTVYVGLTPRGHQIYREVGTDRYFVRRKKDSYAESKSNPVRDRHGRTPIGRFKTFTEAARYVDGITREEQA